MHDPPASAQHRVKVDAEGFCLFRSSDFAPYGLIKGVVMSKGNRSHLHQMCGRENETWMATASSPTLNASVSHCEFYVLPGVALGEVVAGSGAGRKPEEMSLPSAYHLCSK